MAGRRFKGYAPRFEIDRALARKLDEFSWEADSTLFITLLSAFFVLLHRYTQSRDILIASGLANRRWESTEDLIGMFVNTVILRGQVDGAMSFRDLHRRIHRVCLDAYQHQELPFEEVLKATGVDRIPGISPFAQCSFSFHDSAHRPVHGLPLDAVLIEALSNGSSKFDLNIIATPRYSKAEAISRIEGGAVVVPGLEGVVRSSPRSNLDGITVSWEYDADLFDEGFIEGLWDAYLELLRSLVINAGEQVSRLRILSMRAEQYLLHIGTGSEVPYTTGSQLLHELVGHQALLTPHATAVTSGNISVSYRELVDEAKNIAGHLQWDGIGRGDIVVVVLPRSIDAVIASLGVLFAGAAYLPLDPCLPKSRIALILAASHARTVIASDQFIHNNRDFWEKTSIELLSVEKAVGVKKVWTQSAVTEHDLAYVIYTSGSTGIPKGVAIEHHAVVSRLKGLNFYLEGTAYLSHAAVGFDFTVAEWFGPLIHGGSLHLLPENWDLRALAQLIQDHRIRHVTLTTSLFHKAMIEMPDLFTGVEHVVAAGDVLSMEAVRGLLKRGTRVSNGYGPTEATIFTSIFTANCVFEMQSSVPIGRVLPGTHCVILDDHFQLVPVGATGELYIGGKSIARSYLGMPRRTAESFIPDPFSDVPGARLYRSGDLVRWKADSVLEFLGRRDDQVKIRGFLVEPTEVQSALSSLPQVADAIVNIDIDEEGERRLIAYVLASSGHDLDTRTLRSTMRQRLPEYLVPSVFMIVDDWPLTNNGKVDRDRLPKPIKDTAQSTSRPETIDQVNLLALINCLLKTKIDGIHDNFFDLGITSLSAMRLVAQIVSKFGRDVSLADVLEYPTVAELADSVAFQTKICDTQVED